MKIFCQANVCRKYSNRCEWYLVFRFPFSILKVHWMPTCFHLVCKNFYLQFNRICLICVNSSKPVIIGIVRCQETVRVQIICNHVPTKVVICARTHRNKAQLGIHILKIGNYFHNESVSSKNSNWLIVWNVVVKFREVTPNQSSVVSTVVSGSSGSSQQQHQHQILSSASPLSQFITNGEVQNLRTTTPPHNLSNPQTQQRGQFSIESLFIVDKSVFSIILRAIVTCDFLLLFRRNSQKATTSP